jgi:hypothetical protein
MNKLIKPIICILFITALSYKCLAQQPVQVQRGAPINQRRIPMNQRGFPMYPQRGAIYHRGVPVYPQPGPLNRGYMTNPGMRVERVKEAYIGQQLRLTPVEGSAFWPLYRQYVQDQTAVRILKRQNSSTNSPGGTQQIDRELEYEQQLVEIRKHYTDEFLKILPPQKVSLLYKSELQFNDEMLNILKERTVRRP